MVARADRFLLFFRRSDRGARDLVIAVFLFWGIVLAVCGGVSLELPTLSTDHVFSQTIQRHIAHHRPAPQHAGGLLLGVAVVTLMGCNIAFLRHLRRVYASPRNGVWRSGR